MILKVFVPILPAKVIWNHLHRSAGSKGGSIAVARAKAQLRQMTRLATQTALLQDAGDHKRVSREYPRPEFPTGLLHMRFVFPKRVNFRDCNNCIAAFKAGIDGLQDAGLIKDDTELQVGRVERSANLDPAKQGVYLTFVSNPVPVKHANLGEAPRCSKCGQVLPG